MKSHRKQRRKINSIAPTRWTAYAAAAAATGFAAAHTAEAGIHYSGLVSKRIRAEGKFTFRLGSEGAYFVASHINWVGGSSSFSAGGRARLSFKGAQSASIAGAYGCHEDDICASRLEKGDAISAQAFVPGSGILASDFYFNFWTRFGNFRKHGIGLVGFKFNNGAGDQYGWVRVKMAGPPRNYFGIVDYAYGDPGDTVVAGQTSDDSAPSLESLGGLALGAKGLHAWRQQRDR